jgi:diamine N-acetyltransferase
MIPVKDLGVLRAPEESDLEWLMHLENDTSIWYVSATKEPYSMLNLRQYLSRHENLVTHGQLRLILDIDGDPVGAVDLFDYDAYTKRAGVGIVIEKKHRGKGWSKLALETMEYYAHTTLHIENLYAHVPMLNEPSLRLFKTRGFREVGVLMNWIWWEGEYLDVKVYQKILL